MAVTGEVERKWKKPVVACYSVRPEGPTELRTFPCQPIFRPKFETSASRRHSTTTYSISTISLENMFPNLVEFGTFSTLKMLEHYAVVTAKV